MNSIIFLQNLLECVFLLLIVLGVDFVIVVVFWWMVILIGVMLVYFLVLEVSVFFWYMFDQCYYMLFVIMWNIGICIGEVWMFILELFDLDGLCFFVWVLLEKVWVCCGWLLKDEVCLVLLMDVSFVCQMESWMVIICFCWWELLWLVMDEIMCNWLKQVVKWVEVDGVYFLIFVMLYIFCYSYIMYMFYYWQFRKVIQVLVGYKDLCLMEVYIWVFVLDMVVILVVFFIGDG